MRIAQVLTASTGGIARHVASLAPRLVSGGHEVVVFCPESTARQPDLAAVMARDRVTVHPLAELRGVRAADVVHAHGYKAGALAVAACSVGGPPVVVTWHNAILRGGLHGRLGRLNQRWVASRAALTLGASSDLVERAEHFGARAARLGPVAAPRLPASRTERAEVRRALGVSESELAVLTVGRLAPQKNLGMVLDTAARVHRGSGLRFLIVGDGPERERLAARIVTERLPVELLGSRADIADLLQASDLALLTSTWEARALVAQEALVAGLPLVSTRVGGIEELVGEAALLVPAGDAAAAAAAVQVLAADPGRRAQLAAAGRVRAATWPDEDAVADDVLAAYRQVLRAPPAGPVAGGTKDG